MPNYISPNGNSEIWKEKPEGYFTPEEWAEAHKDEIEQASREAAQAAAQTEAAQIITARLQRQTAQAETFSAVELSTLARAGLFDEWAAGEEYKAGRRLVHGGVVYEVIQAVASQAHQPPDAAGMLAVYRPISADPESGAEPDGTRDSPIPYFYGMDVASGNYYSYEGAVYLAKGDMKPCVWAPGTAGLWQWEQING